MSVCDACRREIAKELDEFAAGLHGPFAPNTESAIRQFRIRLLHDCLRDGSIQELLDYLPIGVSTQAYNRILANVGSREELLELTARQMLRWKSCGPVVVAEIAACLDHANISHNIWADSPPSVKRIYPRVMENIQRIAQLSNA